MDFQESQMPPDLDNDNLEGENNGKQVMHDYFWEGSPEYRRLCELRKKVRPAFTWTSTLQL